jgi:hypothetical protein
VFVASIAFLEGGSDAHDMCMFSIEAQASDSSPDGVTNRDRRLRSVRVLAFADEQRERAPFRLAHDLCDRRVRPFDLVFTGLEPRRHGARACNRRRATGRDDDGRRAEHSFERCANRRRNS